MSLSKALIAAAGNAGESLYVEDVFSTDLYTGNGSTQTITNGIDLDGEGGLVWLKSRNNAFHHQIYDTSRGINRYLLPNLSSASGSTSGVTGFNSDGFDLGTNAIINGSADDLVSWTFRKAKKFFDVVSYTGTGAAQNIAHNLGSVPAFIIVKNIDGFIAWLIYDTSLGNTKALEFFSGAASTNSTYWNNTSPTSTQFTVGSHVQANKSGNTYVAYLFASDAGGFGADGSESIIKCGSFTTDGSGNANVTLGYEPQFILYKSYNGTPSSSDWYISDSMRGMPVTSSSTKILRANASGTELTLNALKPNATGFSGGAGHLDSTTGYIYIAIRRPMKTPKSGTEVFSPVAYSGNSTAGRSITSGFPLDAVFTKGRNAAIEPILYSRLQGSARKLLTYSTAAEASSSTNVITSFDQDGMTVGTDTDINNSSYTYIDYFLKRATGFFDVVCWTGNGSTQAISHGLGVVPDLIITKTRNQAAWEWYVGTNPLTDGHLQLSINAAFSAYDIFGADATASAFTVTNGVINTNTNTYVAYLFATLDGVSKVGSYTGTGSNVDVDCGFSAGARFILIKRTDSTGDWYYWDSARGIIAGNDPYQLMNSTAAEVTNTDYVDPLASGFTVTSTAPAALNASGGTYIFLAIA